MGAAKRRGTFEQRQEAAYDRIDAATVGMKEHMAKLEVMEQESDAKLTEVATKMVTTFLEHEEIRRKRRLGIRIGGTNGSEA